MSALVRNQLEPYPPAGDMVFRSIAQYLRPLPLGLLVWAVATFCASAAPQGLADSSYLIKTWETADGLPENSATSITQTPDGYLWFGTFKGLVRFNGVEFKVFNPANTPE